MSYMKLDELNLNLDAYSHALAILGVDEATIMPEGGGNARSNAISTLAAIAHKQASAPEIANWIKKAQNSSLTEDEAAGVNEFKRVYEQNICLSADFVGKKTQTSMNCEQLWRRLRPTGDWKAFAPALKEVVEIARQEAQIRSDATGLLPYDALIEQYDPGTRMAHIDPVFSTLKEFLKGFLPKALQKQEIRHGNKPLKPLNGPFEIKHQRALGMASMKQLGFDFTHGRLDTSHHPFCGGVPSDVRITTRYETSNFLPALMGILHETGHAQYEQGLSKNNSHWPHNKARGMGLHESQSLFVEMQISRSPMFWEWAMPQVSKHLGETVLQGFDVEDVLAHVNLVRPGFIRVDADEITYPLHVILRYELERDLISGEIEVEDIPQAWHEKMVEYLGLETKDNMKDGPMQDVHWPAGLFGYFPSYTLGALMAAQQWEALLKAQPETPEQIRSGNYSAINDWRSKKIWQHGSRLSTPDLMKQSCGQELNPDAFIRHLKSRYGG